MTRENTIYIFQDKGKDTFNLGYLDKIELNKKSIDDSYYSLRIYYYHTTNYSVIYNYEHSKKIVVLDLEKYEKGQDKSDYTVVHLTNEYYVHQSLIYSDNKGDKSLLIVTDSIGIKFYNLKGYSNSWFSDDVGELIKSKNYDSHGGLVSFIAENKLLYAHYNTFRVFELKSINEVYKTNDLLKKKTLLNVYWA